MTDELAKLREAIVAYSETLEAHRAAMRSIRQVVEECSPPGTLPSIEQTGASPAEEAEAIGNAIRKTMGMGAT